MGGLLVFHVEQLKNKSFIVCNKDYRFKEDWLLQAHALNKKEFFEWIDFIDENFADQVKIVREYYTCDTKKSFEGPAGLKLEFVNKKSAEKYCKILNEGMV